MADYLSRWTGQEIDDRLGIVRGRNLFDNPWFTVVQRDYSTVTGIAYNADRWIGTQSTTVTTSSAAGLEVTGYVEQRFDDDLRDFLVGKTVTLSVMMADGTIHSGSAVVPAVGGSQVNVFSAAPIYGYIGYNTNTLRVRLRSNGVASTFRAAKLEIGEVSTLANDVPPNYAEELANCQRYFQVVKPTQTYGFISLAHRAGSLTWQAVIDLPTSMRNNAPTLVKSGNMAITNLAGNEGLTVTAANLSPNRGTASRVCLSLTVNREFSDGDSVGNLGKANDANAYLSLSCDL